jgi:Putative beta-barrel porin-2, OmpL-like. bbp2
MWENRTPNLRSPNPDPLITNANGAICKSGVSTNCTSHEWAVLNYLAYQVGPFDSITFRNEIFNDTTGQRTGFNTTYTEHSIAWQHWIGDVFTFRPEVRYERSHNYAAYNFDPATGRGSKAQIQFAADVIGHF